MTDEEIEHGPRRSRRRYLLGIGAVLAFLVAITGSAALLVFSGPSDPDMATDEDIVVNDHRMRTTAKRLTRIQSVLDALPAYRGTEAERVTRWPCHTDSGGLAQPSLERSWKLSPGTSPGAVIASISSDLAERGWSVSSVSDGSGGRELSFAAGDDWRATGSIFSFAEEERVGVGVEIENARPCGLR